MKISILMIFCLSFLSEFLKLPSNIVPLLFTIIFSITFSLVFIGSVLKDFKNRLWNIINISAVIISILLIIGFTFGVYYLENNASFNLFSSDEYEFFKGAENLGISDTSFIIYKGLIYFYTFPNSEQIILGHPKTLILFFQAILGFLVNVVIIGFFISYFVSDKSSNIEVKENIQHNETIRRRGKRRIIRKII